jgi:GNAT superfamily N-acetyltransferase
MALRFEALSKLHDRSEFDCGKPALNEFLIRFATQYQKRNLARTYVLVEEGSSRVLAYYTLATSSIELEAIPPEHASRLPQHPIPCVLLARLAVASSQHGKGVGARLLRDCFERCLLLAQQIGIHAIVVDAIDEAAAQFYEHFDFVRFVKQQHKLILPLSKLVQTQTDSGTGSGPV